MRITGFHHVAVNVRDLDVSAAFFNRVLGFSAGPRTQFRQILRQRTCEVHLFQAPEPDAAGPRNWRFLGVQHVAFGVSEREFERAAEALSELGLAVEGPVEDETGRTLYVRDPDGNVIELRQQA